MGCPHGGGRSTRERGVNRRQFLLSAVAIGGTSALAACMDREEGEPAAGNTSTEQSPQSKDKESVTDSENENPDESSEEEQSDNGIIYRHLDRADAQHAWNNYLESDEYGVPQPPQHHVLVLADYAGPGTPTDEERATMEQSLSILESAYEWSNDGLLFTVGYSPAYFDRFDADLPPAVDLPEPTAISQFESPTLEGHDISIHLASDHAQAVLGAEEALFGSVDEIQGERVEANLDDILQKRDRRTGFIGSGLPADNQDVEGIPDSEPVPEEAPLFMGFETQSGVENTHPLHGETEAPFVHNQNSEYGVMIKEGRFRQGTTQHISRLTLELEEWYQDHSLEERMDRMFAGSRVSAEQIGERGQHAEENTVFPGEEAFLDGIESSGQVGHSMKVARAREDNIAPLLRRDFDTTDGDHAGVHFVSLQEEIADFVRTRSLMDGAGLATDVDEIDGQQNNGILEFVTTESRANFLIPPRDLRSLPRPQ